MKLRAILFVSLILAVMAGSISAEENLSAGNNTSPGVNLTNETVPLQTSLQEELMNLAFDAREFALEEGKDAAITEFSNPSGRFSKDGKYIIAYGTDGVLLADPMRTGDIGSRFISDDHDSGIIRQMRDLAATGGGLFTDPATGTFWFISDIDGSWWISAALNQKAGSP